MMMNTQNNTGISTEELKFSDQGNSINTEFSQQNYFFGSSCLSHKHHVIKSNFYNNYYESQAITNLS